VVFCYFRYFGCYVIIALLYSYSEVLMGRGPSYPYVDLESAIALTRKVYDYAKRGTAAVESVVAEALGFSLTSSSGDKVMAALRQFGLTEDAGETNGKSVKITARAIRILLDDQESEQRQEEIKKAAVSPKWYEYCWSKWGKEMPPAMRSNLLIEHGFVESTVDGFLSNYKKSIAFAGLLDDVLFDEKVTSVDKSKDSFEVGDWVQWETQGCLRLPTAKRISAFLDGGKYATVDGSSNPVPVAELIPAEPVENAEKSKLTGQPIVIPAFKPVPQQEGGKMQTDVIAIGGNSITIQIQWPTEITQEAYDDLVDYLALLQKRAKRAITATVASTEKQESPE
jgi:hypothetical protein